MSRGLIEEPINLDGVFESDLEQFIKECSALRAYAVCSKRAMTARLAGKIPQALRLEEKKERMYNALPEHLRW